MPTGYYSSLGDTLRSQRRGPVVLTLASQTQRPSSMGDLIWNRGDMALISGRGLGLLLLSFQRGPLLCEL